jgi:heptosyltransferase I
MRILIVKLSAIGDVIHTLPAAAFLKRALPQAHIAWAVERPAAAILRGSPAIDELLELDTRALRKNMISNPQIAAFRTQLGSLKGKTSGQGFDVAIDFQGLLKSAMVLKATEAPRRIGFATSELREKLSRFFLTEQIQTASLAHVIDKNLALARALVDAPETQEAAYQFPIAVAPEDEQYIDEALGNRLQKFAILNPGGGWMTKLWSVEKFAEVADWLWDEYGITSLVTYGPGEEHLAQAVQSNSRQNTVIAFPSTLKQLVALARRAQIFVGGDTGPLHIAAACGTPIVGIYGPTSPERNGPFNKRDITVGRDLWCRANCHKRKCWHWECMEIAVEEVTRAVAIRLSEAHIEGRSPHQHLVFNL